MPRNLCTPRPEHHFARQRARANWLTLALAALSIVCAAADAWWMSNTWV
jgi:hypothetical protein